MTTTQCRSCRHVRLPRYHSGFTGKSGPETWWGCAYHKGYLRHIKKCDNLAGINITAPVMRVRHAKLKRYSKSSLFKSVCPKCKEGVLLVCRDQNKFVLLAEDLCVLCGQRFVYTDIEEMRKGQL